MMRRDTLPSLILFVIFLLLVFATIVANEISPSICTIEILDSANCFEFWVNRYQTFLSGMIALIAAGIGAAFLYMQIAQSDRQEAERVQRKHDAARSMLPLALSQICRFAEENAQAIRDSISNIRRNRAIETVKFKAKNQNIDGFSRQILAEFIENTHLRSDNIVFRLVSKIQIYEARSSRLTMKDSNFFSFDDIDDLIQCAADCIAIYCYAGSIFPYARRELEKFEQSMVSLEELQSVAYLFGFRSEDAENLRKYFLRRIVEKHCN